MAGNENSGRKSRNELTRKTTQIIFESAPDAVWYLRMVSNGLLGTYKKVTTKANGTVVEEELPVPADPGRLDACKYLINQALGMPRQRQDIDLAADGLVKIQVIYDKPLPEIESPGTEIIEIQPQ